MDWLEAHISPSAQPDLTPVTSIILRLDSGPVANTDTQFGFLK